HPHERRDDLGIRRRAERRRTLERDIRLDQYDIALLDEACDAADRVDGGAEHRLHVLPARDTEVGREGGRGDGVTALRELERRLPGLAALAVRIAERERPAARSESGPAGTERDAGRDAELLQEAAAMLLVRHGGPPLSAADGGGAMATARASVAGGSAVAAFR